MTKITDVIGNPIEDHIEEEFDLKDWVQPELDDDEVEEVKLNDLTFQQVRRVLQGAQGKVLTIIDATFNDEIRIKYVKDLIRNAFSQQGDWLFELSFRDFEKPETKAKSKTK